MGFDKRSFDKDWRKALRNEVVRRYGSQCHCCGLTTDSFLTLDHVEGGGNKHRAEIGRSSHALHKYIKAHDFPPSFQLLCSNCNSSKAKLGYCEHEAQEAVLESFYRVVHQPSPHLDDGGCLPHHRSPHHLCVPQREEPSG